MHMKHVRVAFCPRRQIHRLIYIRSDRITPLSASRDALCQHFQTNEQIWHYRCWFSTNPALRVLRNFLIHSVLIFYVIAGISLISFSSAAFRVANLQISSIRVDRSNFLMLQHILIVTLQHRALKQ